MKKRMMIFCAAVLVGWTVLADLVPDTITLTWSREDTTAIIYTNVTYLAGVTYRLTNCLALVSNEGGTNPIPQDLTGLDVVVRAGDTGTNIPYTATAQSGTNGLFDVDIMFPTWTPGPSRSATGIEGLQLTLTDTNTDISITYKGRKNFTVTQPLQ